ncbi:MAG: rhomboid family intramembrane serine protease [Candidatus Micrarchaeia archaeon]|jgi:hypothetical protein
MKRKNGGFSFPLPEGRCWLWILGIACAVFALQVAAELSGFGGALTSLFAFTPATALTQPWVFVTAMFMHGGLTHLFFNMFALFMFGPLLEHRVGSRNFLLLYFASGILGSVFYLATSWGSPVPALGASGAIYGVLGAMAMLEPNLPIYMMFVPMPMWLAAIGWVFIEFTSSLVPSDIANWAHLGGLAFGFAFGYFLRNRATKFIEDYDYYE